jgi:hypothetical protein
MKYDRNTGEFVTNSTTFTALTVPHENSPFGARIHVGENRTDDQNRICISYE